MGKLLFYVKFYFCEFSIFTETSVYSVTYLEI